MVSHGTEQDGQSHVHSGRVCLAAKLIIPEGSGKGEKQKPEAGIVLSRKKSEFLLVRKGSLLKG